MIGGMAWRSLRRNTKRTAITVAAVALGLQFAIVYAAFEQGLSFRLENELVRLLAGHITLEHPDYRMDPGVALYLEDAEGLRRSLEAWPGVNAAKPLVIARGLVKSSQGSGYVEIRGVDPSAESRTSPLVPLIVSGRYLTDRDAPEIVLGESLARRLRVAEGSRIVLATAGADGVLMEVLCRVSGVFQTGISDFDSFLVHVPLEFLRDALQLPPGSATQIGVLASSPANQKRLMKRITSWGDATSVAVYPWQRLLPELDALTRLIKASVWILEGVLLILVLFMVWNTLLMSILERRREFAVQRALGTPPGFVKRQLFLETVWIAAVGTFLGFLWGGGLSLILQYQGVDFERFLGERIPVMGIGLPTVLYTRLTVPGLIIPTAAVLAGVLVLGLLAMRRATQAPLAESLREGKP
jgi:putative ABC transport system permease protein